MTGENSDVFPNDAHVLDADLADHAASGATARAARTTPVGNNAWSDVTRITSSGHSSFFGEPLRFFDDYEVLEELARGGMGVVYRARRISDQRLVAVKMILSGQFAGEADLRRFRTESEAVSRLDHPGIVPIFGVGEFQGRPYFSMELLEGRSLAQLVESGPLAPREAARLLRLIAEAMQYAHGHGVIHRDLKPKNILLDGAGRPKITDFGLAKRLNQAIDLTATGEVVGTPSYMPPEQALGEAHRIGPASDVYALGAMLYCLLTGRPPFLAPTWMDTLLQVREKTPPAPSLLQPSIPPALEAICLKCLEKDPAQRYPTAQALADDLTQFLADAPTQAQSAPWWRGAVKTAREHAWLAGSASLAVAAGLYVLWTLAHAVFEARDYAAQAMKNAEHAERRAIEAERRAAEAERHAQAAEEPQSRRSPWMPPRRHDHAGDGPEDPAALKWGAQTLTGTSVETLRGAPSPAAAIADVDGNEPPRETDAQEGSQANSHDAPHATDEMTERGPTWASYELEVADPYRDAVESVRDAVNFAPQERRAASPEVQ